MAQVTSENIRKFVGQAAAAYGDAWKAQADYYEGLLRRNTKAWTELADARIESFKEMRESRTFNQAFEANLAFEEKVREELVALQEANTRSWESLVENLKAIYTPASAAPTAKPPVSKAAKPKPPVKKTAKAKAPARKTAKAKAPARKTAKAKTAPEAKKAA
ncbi:MAG: hypothetical protein ACO22K_10450 [Woeseiaceae bacterium]|jgi:hypothetical protein